MGIFDKLRGWFTGTSPKDSPPPEQGVELPYDKIRIVNPDGTIIQGHDAVKAYFDEEQNLLKKHGSTINFQVYRVNLRATVIDELQGDRLAEIKVESGFVSGTDTVADVKKKFRSLVEGASPSAHDTGAASKLSIGATEQISFSFGGRQMMDDKLFYADHFMRLPVWVQVLLHDCDIDELMAIADKLKATSSPAKRSARE